MKYLWWCLALYSAPLTAGDTHGNGGDVVDCAEEGGRYVQTLDYFEARATIPPLPPALGQPGWDAITKALFALERIKFLDPARFTRYETAVRTFYDKVERWIEDGPPLEDIDDAGAVKLPAGCRLIQAAIRRKAFHPSIKPYLVDKRIWNRLDDTERAGLILHEVIYGDLYQLGHKDSLRARRFNALVSSTALEGVSEATYHQLTRELFKVIYPPVFRSQEFDINVFAGDTLSLSLRTLLLHPVEGALRWNTLEALPGWLEIKGESLVGAPPVGLGGTAVEFGLVVRDASSGSIAKVRVHVK